MKKISQFQGPYRFLSNFWPAKVRYNGVDFPTVEHAYVYAKLLNCYSLDSESQLENLLTMTPGEAKRFGSKLRLKPSWTVGTSLRTLVMSLLIQKKFSSANPELVEKLLVTGDAILEEGNTWGDKFWGVDIRTGKGQNWLGRLIMTTRKALQDEK